MHLLRKISLVVLITFLIVYVSPISAMLYEEAYADVKMSAPSIAGGRDHTLALKTDGTVWSWGSNTYGQLGDGSTSDRYTPVQVRNLTGVVAIAAGGYHSLALKSDGTVWAWGDNRNGQLGDGTAGGYKTTPVQVKNLTGVVAIAAGYQHSLALKSDGTVWAWGHNSRGELGDGSNLDRYTPVQVKNLTGVVAIAAGFQHSLALKSDGTVWSWGENSYGQLGDESTSPRYTPVQVKNLTGVVTIAAGNDHSLAIKSDGTVWAWGYNSNGQLGNGIAGGYKTTPVQVRNLGGPIAIAAGGYHSLALKSDGAVLAWGHNSYGQLGIGLLSSEDSPVQVKNLTGVVAIAAGYQHSLALKSDGTVWAWGSNAYGRLGDGTTTMRMTPVQVLGPDGSGYFNVNPVVDSITASPSSVNLPKGRTQQLTVTAKYSDGSTRDVTNSATYSSSNTSVATVSASGLVTAVNTGNATITVSYEGKTAQVPVTVTAAVVDSITASPSSVNLPKGRTQQLTVTAKYSDGSTRDVTNSATYSSSNTSVATVSASGLVTAVNTGNATIAVSYGGKTAQVPVTVTAAVVDSITASPSSVNLPKGRTQQLTVTAKYSDGSTRDVTNSATYSSSNTSVATVSASGLVTAVNTGNATIAVSYGGKTAQVPVTVTADESVSEPIYDEGIFYSTTGIPGTLTVDGKTVKVRFIKGSEVELYLKAPGAEEVKYSMDNITWTSPIPISPTETNKKIMALPDSEGFKAVYARLPNGKVYVVRFVIDRTPPVLKAQWKGNATVTRNGTAAIVADAVDNMTPLQELEYSIDKGKTWRPLSSEIPVSFDQNGYVTVTLLVRDKAGNVSSVMLGIFNFR